MNKRGVSRVNPPSTWTHGPHGKTDWQDEPFGGNEGWWSNPHIPDSGSRHTHRFSEDVNQHWGRYPGGNHQAPLTGSNFGYRHRHLQGSNPLTGSMNRGGRGGGSRY